MAQLLQSVITGCGFNGIWSTYVGLFTNVIMTKNLRLIFYKSLADLRAESSRAYLGFLWWLIEPIMFMGAFYLVFAVVLKQGGEHFVAYLLIALVVWKWFATSVTAGSNAITQNEPLIMQVYIEKWVFVAIAAMSAAIRFSVTFLILLIFLHTMGYVVTSTWLWLIPTLFVQALLGIAIGLILAAVVPFLPDVRKIIENGLLFLFFISGIFFDISKVPDEYQKYLFMNPMASLIDTYRSVIVRNELPDLTNYYPALICIVLCGGLGTIMIKKYDRLYPKLVL